MLSRPILRLAAPLAAAFALNGCATLPAPTDTPVAASRFDAGMVSAADPRAADAGVQMLRQGGNAADAAMATMLALTVVEPQSSGIGGGGFLLLDPEGDGDPITYDGRETAPASATAQRFVNDDGTPMPFLEAWPGGKSVGVPGSIALMAKAHGQHGALAWKALFTPAIALARDGFAMTDRLRDTLADYRVTGALSAEARALYYNEAGEPLPTGTVIRNAALAAFLERLAEEGPSAFYTGANAEAIAAAVGTAPTNPATLTAADIGAYDAIVRAHACGTYRTYTVCGMGPPSSGATTVFAILKQVEHFDMAAMGKDDPKSWHVIAESMRLAFADRERWLADPAYADVPVSGLLDAGYLAARGKRISLTATMQDADAGMPPGARAIMADHTGVPENGTSHFVAVDAGGGIASYTSTIESAFGSGLVVNGYYLNNELTDFSFLPEKDGLPVANRVSAGKRPRSSMSPTIVYGPDGGFRLAIGAAGGSTIIAQVAKAIIGVIDWNLPAQEAIGLPVLYSPGATVYVEEGTEHEAMIPALKALGHADVRTRPGRYKANAVEVAGGTLSGAADVRSEGVAISQ